MNRFIIRKKQKAGKKKQGEFKREAHGDVCFSFCLHKILQKAAVFFLISGLVTGTSAMKPKVPAYAVEKTDVDLESAGLLTLLELLQDTRENTANPQTAAEPEELWAASAVLYDADAGRVLFGKNPYEKLPMASTTKIMTLLVVLENSNPSEIVTVSKKAAAQPDVQLGMREGEKYRVKDLCYSLMLESHNDTAVALAEHVGGSVEGFAALMNQKALDLGAYHTQFVTPNGLDADGHFTTAEDLARIAAYAIRQPEFQEITTTTAYAFSDVSGKRYFSVTNKNRFLTMMDGAIGVKTGFTGKAGYCFVGAIKKADRTLVSVVLASRWPPFKEAKWSDTKKLMNYGLTAYSRVSFREYFACTGKAADEELLRCFSLPALFVADGDKKEVRLCYAKTEAEEFFDISMLLKSSEKIDFTLVRTAEELAAPVYEGEQVGFLIASVDGTTVKKIPVLTAEAAAPADFKYYFLKVLQRFFAPEKIF